MISGPETSIADVALAAGINPEVITLGVSLLAPRLVSPLAAVAKRWRKTTGPDTRTILKVLTALIVGVGGWALGLYGWDLRGVFNGVCAAFLAYFKAVGDYERDVNVRTKAERVSRTQALPVPTYPPIPSAPREAPASWDDLAAELNSQTRDDWPAIPGLDDGPPYR